jgi:hypothetical protein
VHVDCPCAEVYDPGGHAEQLFAVPGELAKNPAGHDMHAELLCVLVGTWEYFPAGQSSHVITPEAPENFPAGHAVHVPVAVDER